MNQWARGLLLPLILILTGITPHAALVLFDEDDPLGDGFHDSSYGHAQGGSTLNLAATSKDKLTIQQRDGRDIGVLEWTSRKGGNWFISIFNPGFAAKDASREEKLELTVNGPLEIRAEDLPSICLESGQNQFGAVLELKDCLEEGIDNDPETWQTISIPLEKFEGPENFSLSRVRAVQFRQARVDEERHTLWIDSIRFTGTTNLQATPPGKPVNLVARAGDKSMTLHWTLPEGSGSSEDGLRFEVFRASSPDAVFQPVKTMRSIRTPSFADTSIENGKPAYYQVRAVNEAGAGEMSDVIEARPRAFRGDKDFLRYLQQTAFDYFWFEASAKTGLVRDRSELWSASSIAATGFGLSAICIAAEHGWITREEAAERVEKILTTLWNAPQGASVHGTSGYNGWFYHFLEPDTGLRFGASELSSIDTALLLAGVLHTAEFFDGSASGERIRILARNLFNRVDWRWMLNQEKTLTMGWMPESGFLKARWTGYNEAHILYLLGCGAEKEPLGLENWTAWTGSFKVAKFYGYEYVPFAPLFGHQYSACWIDFRGVADEFMRGQGMDYFENSRRATLAQIAYCIENPKGHAGYSRNVWGLTACDGPGSNGAHGYIARGAPPSENDDGTIAPTAAGGSIAFTPVESTRALRHFYDSWREKIWCGYGFRDAFHLGSDWWGPDVIGIDQGAILLMIENHLGGGVWDQMKKSPVLKRGLAKAGFEPVK